MPGASVNIAVRRVTIAVAVSGGPTIEIVPSRRAVITVASVGVQGPTGPEGPAGANADDHVHTQGSAASVWTVNHNLGRKPLVSVRTVGGAEAEADIVHVSDNQLTINLASAQAGTARCL